MLFRSRVVECPEKVVMAGDLEAQSKWTEISEPNHVEAKSSGIHNCGPNTAVTSQARLGVEEGSKVTSHLGPSPRPDPPIVSPEMQV